MFLFAVPLQTLCDAAVMNETKEVVQVILFQMPVKALLSVLPCLFFLYVNAVMLFAFLRKPQLLESSRYILFGHLLFTESLQLLLSLCLYIFALTKLRLISYVCVTFTLLAALTVKMSPLNLAVMSLERYVAVCFPLRHADIATSRTTGIAIAVMWTVASFESFTQLFLYVSLENTVFTLTRTCHRKNVFLLQIYSTLHRAFIIMCFVFVSIIIIFTYVAIMVTVRSATSNVRNATKAHKTVLLHMLQLCLCLTSTMFDMLISRDMQNKNPAVFVAIQYILFVFLIVFPKCLSPLIYGLRDKTFRHVFKYHFTFSFKTTVKPSSGT